MHEEIAFYAGLGNAFANTGLTCPHKYDTVRAFPLRITSGGVMKCRAGYHCSPESSRQADGTMLHNWWFADSEMLQQRGKSLLVGNVVLPASEVADVSTFTQSGSPILAGSHHGLI